MKELTVGVRESEIMRYLRQVVAEHKTGATTKEIYDAVRERLGDTVTIQSYYKVLNRMEATEKIEKVPSASGDASYRPTQRLTVDNAMTLDDFYDLLPLAESTTEILSALERAQMYYQQKRETTLREAAKALLGENAVDVFFGTLKYWIELFDRDLQSYRHKESLDDGTEWTPLADAQALRRLKAEHAVLERLAYRALCIPRSVLDLPSPMHFSLKKSRPFTYQLDRLREVLKRRVFGDTFLCIVDVLSSRGTPERMRLTVSGSDSSMHAGTIALRTASAFFESEGNIITFNNSAACLVRRSGSRSSSRTGETQLTHSAPFTRQTIDDPNYRGMVLAHSLFRDLSEAEYQHMVLCATDVVQFRVDADVMTGRARDVNTNVDWPTPRVHIRDGTITPQEREFSHYNRLDAYGAMVREGIKLERSILDRLIASPSPPIFAGAVKSTQQHVFGYALDWYIAHGSKHRQNSNGFAIDPDWDANLAEHASDTTVMTYLFTALPKLEVEAGRYYVSCAILRQFPSLTEFYNTNRQGKTWENFFEEKRRLDLERYERYSETLHYHSSPDSPADLSDDDFVFMCNKADFVSFYVGHTAGDPSPTVPRYEFLTSLREFDHPEGESEAKRRVLKTVAELVIALDETRFAYDSDHNFLSSKILVKVVPSVVYRAHEVCKQLGKKLEAELKSTVIRLLAQDRQFKTSPDAEVTVRPVPIKRYLERYLSAARKQDSGEDPR